MIKDRKNEIRKQLIKLVKANPAYKDSTIVEDLVELDKAHVDLIVKNKSNTVEAVYGIATQKHHSMIRPVIYQLICYASNHGYSPHLFLIFPSQHKGELEIFEEPIFPQPNKKIILSVNDEMRRLLSFTPTNNTPERITIAFE